MDELPTNTILTGDSFEVLQTLPNESAHAIVSDPPYGLEFMGKEWDKLDGEGWRSGGDFTSPGIGDRETDWPSFGSADTANATCENCGGRERGANRCDCEEPDWRVKGKPVEAARREQRAGQARKQMLWHLHWAELAMDVLKPGGHIVAFGGNRTHHHLMTGVEYAGFEVRDTLTWHYGSGFPKALDVSKAIDKAAGEKREVVGKSSGPNNSQYQGERYTETRETSFGKVQDQPDKTAPATDAAREWDGWKTALKPATEFIVLARKPFEGTVAENVQSHGTGALNIDGCRVGTEERENAPPGKNDIYSQAQGGHGTVEGRYPANVVFDQAAAEALDRQVGELGGGSKHVLDEEEVTNAAEGYERPNTSAYTHKKPGHVKSRGDSGGPSRYFHVNGWDDFARQMNARLLYTSKASTAERTLDGRIENAHPTVKPQDLMEWLVKLVTKEDQVVLDPFAGSGTTAAACKALGRKFVAIEKDERWADVARIRCNLTPDDPTVARPDSDVQHGLEAFEGDD